MSEQVNSLIENHRLTDVEALDVLEIMNNTHLKETAAIGIYRLAQQDYEEILRMTQTSTIPLPNSRHSLPEDQNNLEYVKQDSAERRTFSREGLHTTSNPNFFCKGA